MKNAREAEESKLRNLRNKRNCNMKQKKKSWFDFKLSTVNWKQCVPQS